MRRREEDAVGSWGLYMRASVWLTDWLPMVQCALLGPGPEGHEEG